MRLSAKSLVGGTPPCARSFHWARQRGAGSVGRHPGDLCALGLWSGGLPSLLDVHIHHDQRAAGALTASNIRFFFFAICDRLQLKTAGLVRVCKRAMRECMCVLCACVRACVRMYCYVWFTRAM